MKKKIVILISAAMILGLSNFIYASTYTFLDNFNVTSDVSDIVHLGDQTLDDFYQKNHQGTLWEFNFNLPIMPVEGENFSIYIDHYQSSLVMGYFDKLYINDTCLGDLSDSDEADHWYTDLFTANNSILKINNNNLEIKSYYLSSASNWDDFEFTNLYLNYTPTPIPSALWLLGSGLIGIVGIRRKFRK